MASFCEKEDSCQEVLDFQDLMYPIYDNLYKFVFCITTNKSNVDDIFQNTLLNAYNHFSSLKDPTKFKSWIFSIAKNEVINTYRKYNRGACADIMDYISTTDDCMFPEEYILNKEFKGVMLDAIHSLDSDDRYIILLRYYYGLNFEKISTILNVNYNTLRSRHKSVKNKVYKYLISMGYIAK